MTISRDAMREVHLGGRLAEGVVRWSAATQRAALDLVTRQAADAVATFLDRGYVECTIAGIQQQAGTRVADVAATIEHVSKEPSTTRRTSRRAHPRALSVAANRTDHTCAPG